MSNGATDPLSRLLVNDALDRELLASTLEAFVQFYPEGETIQMRFKENWDRLNKRQQIITFLLAKKAQKAMGKIEDERVTPGEIEQVTGIPGGTVRPTLSKLTDDRLISRSDDGKYQVPNWALRKASQAVQGQGENS